MSYNPYLNTFYPPEWRCSQFNDPCSRHSDCVQSCDFGEVPAVRMMCAGTQYEKDRNMGKCQAAFARVGDPCIVGQAPLGEATCGPAMYCQERLYVDADPTTAPYFSLPYVGQGVCMPNSWYKYYANPRNATASWLQ